MSTKVTVTSNFPQIADKFGEASDEIEKQYPLYVRQCAANICYELLKRTYPVVNNDPSSATGGTDQAIKQGEQNVRNDINQMFGTIDDLRVGDLVMAGRSDLLSNLNNPIEWQSPSLEKAWQTKDYTKLFYAFQKAGWEEGDVQIADAPTVEIQAGMRNPETGAMLRPVKKVYVKDRNQIESFIAERIKTVGKMAGGWVQCLEALGRKPTTTMNGNGEGSIEEVGSGTTYGVVATNTYGDFNQMLTKTGLTEKVVWEQGQKFTESVRAMIMSSMKKRMGGGGAGTTTTSNAEPSGGD